uniref:Uncharacterized protein n=2 Tax=Oryza sativa subsp. japonica TaxID=39947 RepID=Q2RA49_ORYSJ|nr:hypothetical protein LOC_Os11g06550 [Oryza sativa Japonica Group]ABA91687.1 hypothetical protein LOC_Os11g06550 [Oryza sativa Japonica Group]
METMGTDNRGICQGGKQWTGNFQGNALAPVLGKLQRCEYDGEFLKVACRRLESMLM